MIPADSRSTEELSSRLDDIAVGAAGHQAVLHPARGRKISRQPHPERQKRSRDDQADHRAAPAIALFGVCHHTVRFRRRPLLPRQSRDCHTPRRMAVVLAARSATGWACSSRVQLVMITIR